MNHFVSSRNEKITVSSSAAIVKGLAEDGGLYTPSDIEKVLNIEELKGMNYQQLAVEVLSKVFEDLDRDTIKKCVYGAYDEKFRAQDITPTVAVGNDYMLELWHGPTCAFKDVALTILPHLMTACYQKENINKDIMILTATSGDTGKAALEGFKDVDHVNIKVLYPYQLVSLTQQAQMETTEGKNVEVLAVKGNFDDCQRIIKNMMEHPKQFDHLQLSSANSINIGRLAPQIVYYFKAYLDLVDRNEIQMGDQLDYVVPTGNFGDILAGYFAKKMGLPIGKLVCGSNCNNVLTEFIATGVYDANRPFHNTCAPSIDILVSSNLERLLYLISKDSALVNSYMNQLKTEKKYQVSDEILSVLKQDFVGYQASEQQVAQAIRSVYEKYHYLMDTHTAVAYCAAQQYKQQLSHNKVVILSTASPFKFSKPVYESLTGNEIEDNLSCMDILHEYTGVEIPAPLACLKNKEVRFKEVIGKQEAAEIIWSKLEAMEHD